MIKLSFSFFLKIFFVFDVFQIFLLYAGISLGIYRVISAKF